MTAESETLGDRVRNLRIEKNLSQDGLAALLPNRHHLSWVSKVEAGTQDPTVADLVALAGALGAPVGWLVTGEASGDSEFIARLKGFEGQLDRRGRNAVLTIAQQQVDDRE